MHGYRNYRHRRCLSVCLSRSTMSLSLTPICIPYQKTYRQQHPRHQRAACGGVALQRSALANLRLGWNVLAPGTRCVCDRIATTNRERVTDTDEFRKRERGREKAEIHRRGGRRTQIPFAALFGMGDSAVTPSSVQIYLLTCIPRIILDHI